MSRLLEESRELIEANAFANHNHIVVEDIQPDFARVTLDIVPDSLNLRGFVHGGALFTLADVCSGMTARTDGRYYVTSQATANFVRGAKEGKLTATSRVVHRGKTSCLIEVEIRDDADKLVYQGSCTYFCITPEGGQDPALKK